MMGGGVDANSNPITTFQSVVEHVVVTGADSGTTNNPTIGINGGASAVGALNDGEFKSVRVEGFDIGYQFSAPDHKIFGGTIRVRKDGVFGWGINTQMNGRVQCHGLVISESRYPLRFSHGGWGGAFYSCWFEGAVEGIIDFDQALSDVFEGLSFYDCHFSVEDDPGVSADYLFDLSNWTPNLHLQSQFKLVGGGVASTSGSSDIKLHGNLAKVPLSVQVIGFNDAAKPLVFSGRTENVIQMGQSGLSVGNPGQSMGRYFTASATGLTFPAIAAGDRDAATVSVPGVRFNLDSASVTATPVNGIPQSGLLWFARVSAADTVQIVMYNATGASLTPTSLDWRVEVITH